MLNWGVDAGLPKPGSLFQNRQVKSHPLHAAGLLPPLFRSTQFTGAEWFQRAAVSISAFTAIPLNGRPTPRFGHQLTDDYLIEHRSNVPVNASAVSKTLRHQLLLDLVKHEQEDPSNLKYSLNAEDSYGPNEDAALGDNYILVNRDIDTVVESLAGPAAINSLMMNRMMRGNGKRYISRDAQIALGPTLMMTGGKHHDQLVSRELANEYLRDRETLVMLATGKASRKAVNADLNNSRLYNALQSLHYGKNGLVDAILDGKDKVLNRKGLESFYASKNMTPQQIEAFNSQSNHIERIPNVFFQNLKTFSPEAIVPKKAQLHENRPSHYFSFEDQLRRTADNESKDNPVHALAALAGSKLQVLIRPLGQPSFQLLSKLPFLKRSVSASHDQPLQIQIRGSQTRPGMLYDDVIFFNDEFNDETAEQVHGALRALEAKKLQQKSPGPIKMLLNSPGGSVLSAIEIRNAINELSPKVKVDVIVQGMAASCGSYLLSSATGNRYATPLARIMVHQAASGLRMTSNHAGNQESDNTHALNTEYAATVAKASGRDLDTVRKDFRQDTWLNPLEAMFYGSKGLLDGILIGSNRVITRENVLNFLKTDPETKAYLKEKYKQSKKDPVSAFLDDRLRKLREPNMIHDVDEFERLKGNDPFDNPIRTIMKVAAIGKDIEEIPALKHSATPTAENGSRTMDHFIVGRNSPFAALLSGQGGGDEDDDMDID